MDDLALNSADLRYALLTRGRDIGLRLYIPGYREDDSRFRTIAYLFLDQALGEFDVETKLRLIQFRPDGEEPEYIQHPFQELPTSFDRLYDELNDLTGKPY